MAREKDSKFYRSEGVTKDFQVEGLPEAEVWSCVFDKYWDEERDTMSYTFDHNVYYDENKLCKCADLLIENPAFREATKEAYNDDSQLVLRASAAKYCYKKMKDAFCLNPKFYGAWNERDEKVSASDAMGYFDDRGFIQIYAVKDISDNDSFSSLEKAFKEVWAICRLSYEESCGEYWQDCITNNRLDIEKLKKVLSYINPCYMKDASSLINAAECYFSLTLSRWFGISTLTYINGTKFRIDMDSLPCEIFYYFVKDVEEHMPVNEFGFGDEEVLIPTWG